MWIRHQFQNYCKWSRGTRRADWKPKSRSKGKPSWMRWGIDSLEARRNLLQKGETCMRQQGYHRRWQTMNRVNSVPPSVKRIGRQKNVIFEVISRIIVKQDQASAQGSNVAWSNWKGTNRNATLDHPTSLATTSCPTMKAHFKPQVSGIWQVYSLSSG